MQCKKHTTNFEIFKKVFIFGVLFLRQKQKFYEEKLYLSG